MKDTFAQPIFVTELSKVPLAAYFFQKKKKKNPSSIPENGQEQRRGGDHRRVLGDVSEGLYKIYFFPLLTPNPLLAEIIFF